MEFTHKLNAVEKEFSLEARALSGVKSWVKHEEFGVNKTVSDKFNYHFKSHKFCFKHSDLSYEYIETTYDIEHMGEIIGYYSLFTDLNGESVDDILVITDEEFRKS
ncbi:hypothetical protein [Agaribacterium sp. ZY112]|uniref:hypothetical protein n=1 Tax=Agaribacterium sp. ZY112 TaxID=3233574 RepID=UPI0035254673